MAAQDVDRHPVVVVATPAAGGLERAAPGDHGPGRHELVVDLAVHPGQPRDGRLEVAALGAGEDPLVQPEAAVAEAVVGSSRSGPVMKPSSDMDM